MIRKSAQRLSEKIMRNQEPKAKNLKRDGDSNLIPSRFSHPCGRAGSHKDPSSTGPLAAVTVARSLQ
jgi:hypothetical protein